MTSLFSCGLGCGTCAWVTSEGSGLLCGAGTSDQTGTWNVENASNIRQYIVNHSTIITMQNSLHIC